MTRPAETPAPPYYAVVFTSLRTPDDPGGYEGMAERMLALASRVPGYLGVESARGSDGFGITVSYWATEEAIRTWRRDLEHLEAQRLGRERWYASYALRICRVERASGFEREGR